MTNKQSEDYLNLKYGSEKEKTKTIKKYIPKELRHLPKEKSKEGKFIVKTKLGYYDGRNFVKSKDDALIYNDYDIAKEVAKPIGKVVRI